jgi:3-oxoacyl-[acyl-carrier-protein] synthase-3
VSQGKGIKSFELGADGSGGIHLYGDPSVKMNGREVFKFATKTVPESIRKVVEKDQKDLSEIDFVIPHQANVRIIEYAAERLGVSMDKFEVTVDQYGNTSAASIPITLFHALQEEKIKDGDYVVMTGFGGGLTWGTLSLVWGK